MSQEELAEGGITFSNYLSPVLKLIILVHSEKGHTWDVCPLYCPAGDTPIYVLSRSKTVWGASITRMFRGGGGGWNNKRCFSWVFLLLFCSITKELKPVIQSKYLGNQIKLQTVISFACGKSLEI